MAEVATDGVASPVGASLGVLLSPDAVEEGGDGDGDGDSEPPGSIGCQVAMKIAPMIATTTITDSGTERRGGRVGGVLVGGAPDDPPGSGSGRVGGVGIRMVGLSSDMWATVYERTASTFVDAATSAAKRCTRAPPDGTGTPVGGDSWHRGRHPWGATVSGRRTPGIAGVARFALTAGHPTSQPRHRSPPTADRLAVRSPHGPVASR